MFGPMLGFMLSAYTLTKFIDPTLTPTITNEDPRWIGAWWMGEHYKYNYLKNVLQWRDYNKTRKYTRRPNHDFNVFNVPNPNGDGILELQHQ